MNKIDSQEEKGKVDSNVRSRLNRLIKPFFTSTLPILTISIILHVGFFLFGLYQDANMEVRYTDIDYFVFTDAARYVSNGISPYERETYRYTPLLAWILIPTSKGYFSFGKCLFSIGDIITGYFILRILQLQGVSQKKSIILSSIWLLNPMVITISTRGSSEGLLAAMILTFLYCLYTRNTILAGIFVGLSIHFKIYPIIYIPTAIWYLQNGTPVISVQYKIIRFINWDRVKFGIFSLGTILILGGSMYKIYGYPFLLHTYLHHLSRSDHRHNFSFYNILLYMSSVDTVNASNSLFELELTIWDKISNPALIAFIPQLLISGVLIPLKFAKLDLSKSLFLQTFAFVTFNKVCTSQYFIWYLSLLPLALGNSDLLRNKKKGITALVLWVVTQGLWLKCAYDLEFLGKSTFYPQLLISSGLFFLANIWILGEFMS